MCNRVGPEGGVTFSGESLVAGPNGELLALAGHDKELLLCEFSLPQAREIRAQRPYTQLRRPELYA